MYPHQTGGALAAVGLRTNREGRCGPGLRRGVPEIRRARPNSLPTPLPGAASGCNVKPNAQTAATEAAAESLAVIPLEVSLTLAGPQSFAVHKPYQGFMIVPPAAVTPSEDHRRTVHPGSDASIASRRGMMVGIV